MPEMSLVVKAGLFGFMLLVVLVIVAYHVILDVRLRDGERATVPEGPAQDGAAKAA